MPRPPSLRLLGALLLGVLSAPARAGEEDSCPAPDSSGAMPAAKRPLFKKPSAASDDREQPVRLNADRLLSGGRNDYQAIGDVQLTRGTLRLGADELHYQPESGHLDATGKIRLERDGEIFDSKLLSFDLTNEVGDATQAQFSLGGGQARGNAGKVQFLGRDRLVFEKVTYTTCPAGHDDWFLHARALELDRNEEIGTGRHVWLEFMRVPVLYLPYFSFPLTEARKSGFLAPHFGHGDRTGFTFEVPYYFNIAPNLDDTLTPRVMADRGLQLKNEFRYLTSTSNGIVHLEGLADDKKTGETRSAAQLTHNQQFGRLWSGKINARWVSDNNYFIDMEDSSGQTALTHLPRLVQIDYGGPIVRFTGRLAGYQTIDPTIPVADRPYDRLPQLRLDADWPTGPNRLHYQIHSEWTYFDRADSITGQRFNLRPSLSWPLANRYAFFTPRVSGHYMGYQLNNAPDASPSRVLGSASLDTGLFFEREGRVGDHGYRQTLEPRLFYLYVPYRDQDSLPVFDTLVPDVSFYRLFSENRFVGNDRIGDANQVTLALTSRFLTDEGTEVARVSVGEVIYFDDRRVNLPISTVTTTSSDVVAEVAARLGQPVWLRSGIEWNQDLRETRRGNVTLAYSPRPDRIASVSYRYTQLLQEQVDILAQWPLSARWAGLLRWNYDLPGETVLQALAGLEYRHCCWTLRVTASQRILPDGTHSNAVNLQIGLNGFSSLPQNEQDPLRLGRFPFE
jgi:LPS-assembly protein